LKNIDNLQLPDIRVRNPNVLKNKFLHLDIIDNNLVMTLDYDHPQFCIASVLDLMGMDVMQSLKTSRKMMDGEDVNKIIEGIEKRNFEVQEFKKLMRILGREFFQ